MSRVGGDLLILLLDLPLLVNSAVTPDGSADAAYGQADSLLEQVLYFIAAYLMVSESNMLAVYGLLDNLCEALYMPIPSIGLEDTVGSPTQAVHEAILDMVKRTPLRQSVGYTAPRTLALSAGLSRALCLLHRIHTATDGTATGSSLAVAGDVDPTMDASMAKDALAAPGRARPRIMCLLAADDDPPQYVPTMNAIFSAQRADVTIDTLMLGTTHSTYLQQAATLTGGLYLQLPLPPSAVSSRTCTAAPVLAAGKSPSALTSVTVGTQSALQYLLSTLALDRHVRGMLAIAQPLGVDFRASCFCHRQPVDVGYVCSVCLSIFCSSRLECATCGAEFGQVPANKSAVQ